MAAQHSVEHLLNIVGDEVFLLANLERRTRILERK